MKNKFYLECEKASALIGEEIVSYLTWNVESKRTYAYEDDGCLHLEKRGLHVCVGIGQDRPLREQNERIKKVVDYLGFKPSQLNEHLYSSEEDIQEEEDEENDICPCCGNPRH